MQAQELDAGVAGGGGHGLLRRGQAGLVRGVFCHGETEFLVLMRGGNELVGVGVHARGQPQHDPGRFAAGRRDRGDALQLGKAVHHDPAQLHVQGTVDLGVGFIVPVEGDVCSRDARAGGDGEFPAGGGVQAQPFLLHPADNRGAQERLPGVVDVHSPADVGERVVEGIAEGARPGPEVVLAHHEQRRAELVLELADRNAVNGELAGVVPGDAGGPHGLVERVEVCRDVEPLRGQGGCLVQGIPGLC
ncbi:hypothetical protein D9M72_506770 [compost metagenome]